MELAGEPVEPVDQASTGIVQMAAHRRIVGRGP